MGRYVLFGFLLCGVMIFGFEAGKRGLDKNAQKSSNTPFKSLPLFSDQKDPHAKIVSEQKEGNLSKPETKEEKKKEETIDKKEEKSPSVLESGKEVEVQNSNINRLNSADTLSYILYLDQQNQKEKKSSARIKTLPQFSTVYVPVYAGNQLGVEALQGFGVAFPRQTVLQKIFVIEKEAGSSAQGSRYQVIVYDKTGKNFIGSFETRESHAFPFIGIPVFTPVDDAVFQKTSRFIIISESDSDISHFLNHEPYLHSILRSAYAQHLNAQTFLGTHKQFKVDIYTIFPGVFLALR